MTVVYNPRAFVLHAASLRQACAHCGRFSTAASRRSLGSVSVPVLAVNLSVRLDVLALVSRYLTNKLISHEPLPNRKARFQVPYFNKLKLSLTITFGISARFQTLFPSWGHVIHVLLTLSPLCGDCSLHRTTCMPHPRRQHSI